MQGVVKAGLVRVREGSGSRARELAEEALALQEGLDGAQHSASERAEENAALATQARTPCLSMTVRRNRQIVAITRDLHFALHCNSPVSVCLSPDFLLAIISQENERWLE